MQFLPEISLSSEGELINVNLREDLFLCFLILIVPFFLGN